VWEWTSSGWHPYPGFTVFPYREYSQVFFGGDYRVLRGGSFGTDRSAIRPRSGTGIHPIRRQIFRLPLRPRRVRMRTPPDGGWLRCAATSRTSAPPVRSRALLLDPPHGLLHQSYAPADMRGGGTVNADGFGAAGTARRARGRRRRLPQRPAALERTPAFAALRRGDRPAAGAGRGALGHPGNARHHRGSRAVRRGAWLFSHNGVVRGWPGSVAGLARSATGHGPAAPGARPRTPRCCGRWSATGCGAATTRRRAAGDVVAVDAAGAAAPG
jgi:hypothetical protein